MNNSDDTTRKLSSLTMALAVICLAVCLTDWFKVSGNRYGVFYGVFVDPPSSGFSAGGPNYYQSINSWYFVISICLIVFIAEKLLGRSLPAVAVRIFALCVAVFPFMNMLMYKYDVMSVALHYEWLALSIYLDWACLIVMATMTCLEIISLISRTGNSKNFLLES